MGVIQISDEAEFDGEVSKAGNKLVVIDMFATWCGPCRVIAPFFESCSEKYSQSAVFLKVDVDKVKSVAMRFSVRAMPTFIFLKDGQKVDQVMGADQGGIEKTIKKYVSPSESGSFQGTGRRLGDGAPVSGGGGGNAISAFLSDPINTISGWEPHVKVLAGLVVLYACGWLFG